MATTEIIPPSSRTEYFLNKGQQLKIIDSPGDMFPD